MCRIMIAARATVHADLLTCGWLQPVQHLVVQGDEGAQQSFRRIQFERKTRFRKIYLYRMGSGGGAIADIFFVFVRQVCDKGLTTVSFDACSGVEQAKG